MIFIYQGLTVDAVCANVADICKLKTDSAACASSGYVLHSKCQLRAFSHFSVSAALGLLVCASGTPRTDACPGQQSPIVVQPGQ